MSSAVLTGLPTMSPTPRRDKRIFSSVFRLFTALLVLLPAGSIFGLNVKILLFLVLMPLAVWMLFQSPRLKWTRVAPLVLVPLGVVAWSFLVQTENASEALATQQAKDIVSMLAGAWFISIYCELSPKNPLKFVKLVIILVACTSGFKALLFAYALATGTETATILKAISDIFHVALMSYDFDSSELGRVVLYSDGLIPLCIFAVFNMRQKLGLNSVKMSLLIALYSISAFMTFTRFLWGFSLVALLLALLATKLDKSHLKLMVVIFVLFLSTLGYTSKIVSLRFSDNVTADSDQARTDQDSALMTFFKEGPIVGHGLGSYIPNMIRSSEAPYSYENQLGALLGQIGVVGCSALAILMVAYYYRAARGGHASAKYKIALLGLLTFWLFGGFLNPQVISSASAVSFGMLLAMALVRRTDDEPVNKQTKLALA